MKIILAFLIIISVSFSSELNVSERYLIDKTNSLQIEDILQKEKSFNKIEKYNLGISNDTIWLNIKLKNSSSSKIEKRVFNKTPAIDYISVYLFKNTKLIKTYSLGDKKEHKNRDNIFRINYFDITLVPSEEVEIFIKQKTQPPMDIKWDFTYKEKFEKHYKIENIIYLIFVGIFIFTVISSISFYIALKNKIYLIYALFTLSNIIYQLTWYGFIYELNLQYIFNETLFYIASNGVVVFLALFPLAFFELKKDEYKILVLLLKSLVGIILIFVTLYLGEIVEAQNGYSVFIYYMIFFILLIISIRAFLDKKVGSTLYLIANIIVFVSTAYSMASFSGLLQEVNYFDYYCNIIAAALQDILFGVILVHATLLIKKKNDKNQELLSEFSKLSFIGQTMINISHQWKTPINTIYNSINHIEVAREFNDSKLDEIIDKNIKNIKDTTAYLRDTALNQLDFYKEKRDIKRVNLYEEINNVIKLIEGELTKKSIEIIFSCDKTIEIEIEKNYFLNLIMILFENSFKVFDQRSIENPIIKLDVKEVQKRLEITFEDNAKGASEDIIAKIFDKDFSQSNSTGIGLYLAKEIVSHKLRGQISAHNTEEGILFIIKI